MRFGLLLAHQHLPGTPVAERCAETIEQVRLARELGFDMLAFGQHFLSTVCQMLQPATAAARSLAAGHVCHGDIERFGCFCHIGIAMHQGDIALGRRFEHAVVQRARDERSAVLWYRPSAYPGDCGSAGR